MSTGSVPRSLFASAPRVFVVGGGPSLLGFDFNLLRNRGEVVAVNRSMFDIQIPCIGFSADRQFVKNKKEELDSFPYPLYFAIGKTKGSLPKGTILDRDHSKIFLSDDPTMVATMGNSGYASINFVILGGAKEIILLGFDMNNTNGGRANWHGGYEWSANANPSAGYRDWVKSFDVLHHEAKQRGVKIWNANSGSAIECFPFLSIRKALWRW